MEVFSEDSENLSYSAVQDCIANGLPYEYTLPKPGPAQRDFLKSIICAYLKEINKEKDNQDNSHHYCNNCRRSGNRQIHRQYT